MQYLEAYRFLFKSPKWLTNLLLCALPPLIPVVGIIGAIAVLGYHFEIIEALHLRGNEDYPDVDFNQFLKYLIRGVWVFLVGLILSLPLIVLFLVAYSLVWLGVFSLSVPSPPFSTTISEIILGIGGAAFGVVILASLALQFLLIPMTLRAGLAQEFKAAFSWSFIRDFIERTWREILLAWLFLTVTGLILEFAGTLLFCVGLFAAEALVGFAHAHLMYQLYQRYLERGGKPIPLVVRPAAADTYEEDE